MGAVRAGRGGERRGCLRRRRDPNASGCGRSGCVPGDAVATKDSEAPDDIAGQFAKFLLDWLLERMLKGVE